MPTTLEGARDEALALVKAVTDDLDLHVIWQGTAGDRPEDGPREPWARISFNHVDRRDGAIGGGVGRRLYTSTGILEINLHTPPEGGSAQADGIAAVLRNSIEGQATASGVWFRNARTIEVGLDGGWWRTDVLADFEYDEVR